MALGLETVNPKVIEALELALKGAGEGQIHSLCIIGVSPLGQYRSAIIGSAKQINAGLDIAKQDIIAQIRGGGLGQEFTPRASTRRG